MNIMARGFGLVAGGALCTLAACGGDDGSGPDGGRLTLVNGARVSGTIGAAGDTLTTTAGGTSFTLGISGAALMDTVTISLAPVAEVSNSPIADAGLVAAVLLEPSGTVFATPAELTIELPPGTSTSGLAGFLAERDGDEPHLVPIRIEGTKVTLLVPHFSVAGVVRDASNIPPPPVSNATATFQQQVATELASQNPSVQTLGTLLRDWFQQVVKPALVAAAGSAATDASTLAAQGELDLWTMTAGQMLFTPVDPTGNLIPPQVSSQFAEALTLNDAAMATAISRANDECLAQPATDAGLIDALQAVSNALFWQQRAELYRVVLNPPLDLASVVAGLCVAVHYDNVVFPLQLTVGQTVPFQVRVGLKRGSSVDFVGGLLDVEVQPAGATVAPGQPTKLFTDTTGFFDTQLEITDPAVVVNVHSCASLAFGTFLPRLCHDTLVVRNPTPTGSFTGGYDGDAVWTQFGNPQNVVKHDDVRWFLNLANSLGVDLNLVFAQAAFLDGRDRRCGNSGTFCFSGIVRNGNTFNGSMRTGAGTQFDQTMTITGAVVGTQLTFTINAPTQCFFPAPAGCSYTFTGDLAVSP